MRDKLEFNGETIRRYDLKISDIVNHINNIDQVTFTPDLKIKNDYLDLVRSVY